MIKLIGYTPALHVFERNLQKFKEQKPEIETWINNIEKSKWSLAHDKHGRRFGHMTTNLSEAINKVLKGARNLPITALVRCTYGRMVEYFVARGSHARAELNGGNVYCTKLMQTLQKEQAAACRHHVRVYDMDTTRFEVEEEFDHMTQRGGTKWSVNLNRRHCQCGKFQAYRIPCSHAIAACARYSLDFYQYVDPVYRVDSIIHAYSARWFPMGNDDLLPTTSEWTLVPDEQTLRKKGRPRSTRIRNEMDWVESQPRQRCGICRQPGHNRSQCRQRSTTSNQPGVSYDEDEDNI